MESSFQGKIVLEYLKQKAEVNDPKVNYEKLLQIIQEKFLIRNAKQIKLKLLWNENIYQNINNQQDWISLKNISAQDEIMIVKISLEQEQNEFKDLKDFEREIQNSKFQVAAKLPSFQNPQNQNILNQRQQEDFDYSNYKQMKLDKEDPELSLQGHGQKERNLYYQREQEDIIQPHLQDQNPQLKLKLNPQQENKDSQENKIYELLLQINETVKKNEIQSQLFLKEIDQIKQQHQKTLQLVEFLNLKLKNLEENQQIINPAIYQDVSPLKQQPQQIQNIKKIKEEKEYYVSIYDHDAPYFVYISDDLKIALTIKNESQETLPESCEILCYYEDEKQELYNTPIGCLKPGDNSEVIVHFKMPSQAQILEEVNVNLKCVAFNQASRKNISQFYTFKQRLITPQMKVIEVKARKEYFEEGEQDQISVQIQNSGKQKWPSLVKLRDENNPDEIYTIKEPLQSKMAIKADLEFIAKKEQITWQLYYQDAKIGDPIEFEPQIKQKYQYNRQFQQQREALYQEQNKKQEFQEAQEQNKEQNKEDSGIPESIIKKYKLNEQQIVEVQEILNSGISEDANNIAYYVSTFGASYAVDMLMN